MWSFDRRIVLRMGLVAVLGGLTAGCFQPMYGDSKVVPTAGLTDKLGAVDVLPITPPKGTRLARVGVEVRNDLIQQQVIVDINSGRPDIQEYSVNASYTLTDIGTGKTVVSGSTFGRVSYNIPGQQQRFAGERGLRDAENRAAGVVADNIRTRLASFFVAGT